ncbi:hypothetical protein ACQ86B_28530 (plasmid) [Mycolicibacterium aichiense]|uniref:hypothetical protein n=1 Tax=Mycolicibacterium aichiense TaxID=1799 RepID=UPI003D66DE5E
MIDTTTRAAVIAHMLVRLAPELPPGPQPTCVEPVLAALLYAASPPLGGRGIGWVYELLTTSTDGTLAEAAAATGARTDARWLRHCDELEPLQRQPVIEALRHAVRPWIQRPQCAAGSGIVEMICATGQVR